LAKEDVVFTDAIKENARAYMNDGLRQADASHISCAVAAQADYFITTDKKILNKKVCGITIAGPIAFIEEYVDAE
jgi:predicted nucleic acid-binding protein